MKTYFQPNKYTQTLISIILLGMAIFSSVYIAKSLWATLKFLWICFLPFILAFIIYIFMKPVIKFLEKKLKLGNTLAVLVSLLSVVSLTLSIIGFSIMRLVYEILKFQNQLPQYYYTSAHFIQNLLAKIQSIYFKLPEPFLKVIQKNTENAFNDLDLLSKAIAASLLNLGQTIPLLIEIIVVFFLACVAAFFVAKEEDSVKKFLLGSLPKHWQHELKRVWVEAIRGIIGFLKAQLILAVTMCILSFIGLSIIRVEYALIISMFVGVLSIIPVIGTPLIFVPWIVWQFSINNVTFAGQLLVLLAILLAIREVLIIKIVAQQIGLSPLTTFVAMYVGIQVYGVLGFILGPLTVIVLKVLVRSNLPKQIFDKFMVRLKSLREL